MASAAALSLIASRDSVLAIIAAQTTAWVTAGCPPTFSVDGESYQWGEWLSQRLAEVEKLNTLIQQLRPYWSASRMRG